MTLAAQQTTRCGRHDRELVNTLMTSAALEAVNNPTERRDDFIPFAERMRAVRDLMAALQVVTYAGQNHVMRKVVDILRRDISRLGIPLTDPRATTLACFMMELELEAKQLSPRPSVFNHRVRSAVEVLFEVWSERPPTPPP